MSINFFHKLHFPYLFKGTGSDGRTEARGNIIVLPIDSIYHNKDLQRAPVLVTDSRSLTGSGEIDITSSPELDSEVHATSDVHGDQESSKSGGDLEHSLGEVQKKAQIAAITEAREKAYLKVYTAEEPNTRKRKSEGGPRDSYNKKKQHMFKFQD